MPFVQKELKKNNKHWNLHRIESDRRKIWNTHRAVQMYSTMFQNGKTHAKTAYMTEVDPDEVPVAVDLSCDRSIQAPW